MKTSTTTFRITPEAKQAILTLQKHWKKYGFDLKKAAVINRAIVDSANSVTAQKDPTLSEKPQ